MCLKSKRKQTINDEVMEGIIQDVARLVKKKLADELYGDTCRKYKVALLKVCDYVNVFVLMNFNIFKNFHHKFCTSSLNVTYKSSLAGLFTEAHK